MMPDGLYRMRVALNQERLCHDVMPKRGHDPLLALAYSQPWTWEHGPLALARIFFLPLPVGRLDIAWPEQEMRN